MKQSKSCHLISLSLIQTLLSIWDVGGIATKYESSNKVYFTEILSENKNVWTSKEAISEITVGDRISTTANCTIKIYCPFKGNPYPRVNWFFNDQIIDPIKFENIDTTELQGNSVLVISNFDKKHGGMYTCMVFNRYERQKSTAFVRLIEPFQPTIFSTRLSQEHSDDETEVAINIGTNATFYDGSSLNIRCEVKAAEEYFITWMFNSIPLNSNSERLIIENTKQENSGLYFCKVSDKSGKGDEQLSHITIIKKIFPKIVEGNKVLRYIRGRGDAQVMIGENATVREGFTVKIQCSYYAVPKGKLTWERQGVILLNDYPNEKSHDDKYVSQYIIRTVQMKHSGEYTCVAANRMGKTAVSSIITVIAANSGPPVIQSGSRRRTVEILSSKASNVVKVGDFVKIVEGAPLKLLCNASGVPHPHITWFFGRDPLVDDSVIQTSTMLLILNFQPHHAGDYKCVAKNAVGETRAFTEVRLIVPSAPVITIGHSVLKNSDPLKSNVITIGDYLKTPGGRNITIRCPAKGYPNVELVWMHESKMLQTSEKLIVNSAQKTLTIINSDEWDTGKYACFASNSAGISSGFSFLKVLAQGSPIITSSDAIKTDFGISPYVVIEIGTNLTTITGKTLSILCPSEGAESTFYEWTINKENLNYDARINVLNGSELIINDLQHFDEGIYQCRAFNQHGFDAMISKITIIKKQDEKRQQNDPENIESEKPQQNGIKNIGPEKQQQNGPSNVDSGVIFKDEVTAIKGSTLVLTCALPGATRPQLKWYKNGQFLSHSSKYLPRGEQLVLNNIDDKSAGEYTCELTADLGVTLIIYKVKIEDFQPVTIKKSNKIYKVTDIMKQIEVVIGDTVKSIQDANIKLKCPYVARPNATVYWLHNQKMIKQGDLFLISNNANDLIIPKMDKRYAGSYTCRAVQQDRKDEATTRIELLDSKRPIIYSSNKNLTSEVLSRAILKINIGDSLVVNLNKQIEITCLGEGLPIPKILWKFNGETIEQLNFVDDLKNGSILVKKVLWEHNGKFECFFLNSLGFDYASSRISVVGEFTPHNIKPTARNVFKLNTTKETVLVDIGTNVTIRTYNNLKMLCPVDKFGKVDVVWYKNDKQLELYESTIQLNNLVVEDSGSYFCFTNDPAKLKFGSVEVNVLAPFHELVERSDVHHLEYLENKIKLLSADVGAHVLILLGNSIRFRCPVKENSKVKISWTKNGENFDVKGNNFYRVVEFKEHGNFNVSCLITSVLGSDFFTSQVTVVVPKSPTIIKVEQNTTSVKTNSVFSIGGSITIFDGSSVEIKCETIGFPKPKIVWNYQGRELQNAKNVYFKEERGKTLALFSVTKSNEGIYSCTASNGFEPDDKQSIKVNVKVPRKPTFVKNKNQNETKILQIEGKYSSSLKNKNTQIKDVGENFEVLAGSPLKLKCDVVGEPKPSIEWRKDGVYVFKDSEHFVIETNDVHNSGLYTCTALNEFGAVSESSMINIVVAKIPISQHYNFEVIKHTNGLKNVDVLFGNNLMTFTGTDVSLRCPAKGVPAPSFTFFKDGKLLINEKNITVDNSGLLKLFNVNEMSSAGVYTCRAENIAGFIEINSTLTLYSSNKPKISSIEKAPSYHYNKNTKESALFLTIGQNTTTYPSTKIYIECPVEGFPTPDIVWKVNDEIVMEEREAKISDNKTTLMYDLDHQVSQTSFTCITVNLAGFDEKTSLIQVVEKKQAGILLPYFKPFNDEHMEIKLNIGESADVLVGSTVSISCPVIGEPIPEVMWIKLGRPLGWLQSNRNVSIKNSHLTLYNVDQDFNGEYLCNASNIFGTSIKASTIFIKEKEAPKILSSNKTFVAGHGVNVIRVLIGTKIYTRKTSRIIIECPVSGTPPPKVIWYKGQLVLTHIFKDTITIENAEKHDGGIYFCVATNIAGSVQVSTELVVGFEPQMQSIPPDLSPVISLAQNSEVFVPIGVNEAFVRMNNTVHLQCFTDAFPSPSIEWFYNGFEIDYGDFKFKAANNHVLKIAKMTTRNSGVYSCIAKNPFGQASSKSNLYLMEPPIIKENKEILVLRKIPDEVINIQVGSHLTVLSGTSFSLSCFVSGSPLPTIRWLRNNIRFELSERISFATQKLYFTNVLPQDSATYTCEARNNWGKVKSSTILLVAEQPVATLSLSFLTNSGVSTVSDESVVVPAGSHITLFCHVTGFPIPRIVWLKDHDVFTGTEKKYQLYNQSAIEVEHFEPKDMGSYICVATNILGEATGIINLLIGVLPKISITLDSIVSKNDSVIVHVGSNLDVMPGSSVRIICNAAGEPKPKILWEITPNINSAIQTVQTDNDGEIVLRNVSHDDVGLYTCVARNSIGVDKAASSLSIMESPKILSLKIQYSTNVGDVFFANGMFHVIEGESILLVCDVAGYPLPIMKMQQSNRLGSVHFNEKIGNDFESSFQNFSSHLELNVSETFVLRKNKNVVGVRSQLFIGSARLNHSSFYFCYAENYLGSEKVNLALIVHKKPVDPYRGVWTSSSFSECSKPCVRSNYGIQQREIICFSFKGEVMDHAYCNPLLKISLQRECESAICATEWKTSDWTMCSSTCGADGKQSRVTYCGYKNSYLKISPKNCILHAKPETTRGCNNFPCDQESCVDRKVDCSIIKGLGFCKMETYKSLCCESCRTF
nr:hemicentin-1 [Hydra vulgaris]